MNKGKAKGRIKYLPWHVISSFTFAYSLTHTTTAVKTTGTETRWRKQEFRTLNTEVTESLHGSLTPWWFPDLCHISLPCLGCSLSQFLTRGGFSSVLSWYGKGSRRIEHYHFRTKSSATNRTSNSESHLDNNFLSTARIQMTLTVYTSCFIIREDRGKFKILDTALIYFV